MTIRHPFGFLFLVLLFLGYQGVTLGNKKNYHMADIPHNRIAIAEGAVVAFVKEFQ